MTTPPATAMYPVDIHVEYPEKQSRAIMFFRALLVIPNIIVLYFVMIAAMVVIVIGWFAVMFTGKYPRGMHTFIVGALRWQTRTAAYYMGLTDVYPPFHTAV